MSAQTKPYVQTESVRTVTEATFVIAMKDIKTTSWRVVLVSVLLLGSYEYAYTVFILLN